MAEIYTPNGIIHIKSTDQESLPRPATILYLRQYARAYSPLYGLLN